LQELAYSSHILLLLTSLLYGPTLAYLKLCDLS
jgi:hypothetical protein